MYHDSRNAAAYRRKPRKVLHGHRIDIGWILIFKAISDPVAVIDEFGWVVYANLIWDRLVGLEAHSSPRPYHITKVLPALAVESLATQGSGIENVPMMIKGLANNLTAVTVSARPLPGEPLWVVQALATNRELPPCLRGELR